MHAARHFRFRSETCACDNVKTILTPSYRVVGIESRLLIFMSNATSPFGPKQYILSSHPVSTHHNEDCTCGGETFIAAESAVPQRTNGNPLQSKYVRGRRRMNLKYGRLGIQLTPVKGTRGPRARAQHRELSSALFAIIRIVYKYGRLQHRIQHLDDYTVTSLPFLVSQSIHASKHIASIRTGGVRVWPVRGYYMCS